MIKIYIVCPSLKSGGAERQIVNLVSNLDKNIYKLNVIVLHAGGSIEELVSSAGIELIRPYFINKNFARIEVLSRLFLKMLIERKAIFHFWLPEAYLIGGICGIITRNKRVIMSRRSLNNYQSKYPIFKRLEYFIHKNTSAFVANCQVIAEELITEDVPKSKISVVYNYLASESLAPQKSADRIRSELNIQKDYLIFVCIANLIPYKGHEDLIKAFSVIRSKINAEWRLLLIGRDDGIRNNLEFIISNYNLSENIIFLGEKKHVGNYLQISNIGIQASHEEGLPNSVIEMMAFSLPVIATNVGGTSELIKNDETGILIPARDIPSLSKSLLALANDASIRFMLGKNANLYIKTRFNFNKFISDHSTIYKKVVQDLLVYLIIINLTASGEIIYSFRYLLS